MAQLRIRCVVMAAGNARRFGENKLAVQVQGKTLFRRALEAVPAERFVRTVVVSQYPEVLELAHRMGFVPVPNRHPDWGISHTISLGLGKLPEMDAALFQVADQPLLRRESVGRLVDFYREHPEHIAALGHDGVRGNPCLFPARLFPELLALQGDHGGNQVIRRHEEDLLLWEVPAPELTDVDTPQVLAQLRRDMAEE